MVILIYKKTTPYNGKTIEVKPELNKGSYDYTVTGLIKTELLLTTSGVPKFLLW